MAPGRSLSFSGASRRGHRGGVRRSRRRRRCSWDQGAVVPRWLTRLLLPAIRDPRDYLMAGQDRALSLGRRSPPGLAGVRSDQELTHCQ
jgi:hypothetical protein